MKRFALAGAVLMLAPWAVAEEAGFGPEAAARSVVIRAQSLIDGVSGAPRSHVDILIRGNRIVEFAPVIDGPIEARKAAPAHPGHGAAFVKVFITHPPPPRTR